MGNKCVTVKVGLKAKAKGARAGTEGRSIDRVARVATFSYFATTMAFGRAREGLEIPDDARPAGLLSPSFKELIYNCICLGESMLLF